ncbi:MAG: DUF6873 family GME fold protein [Monoglobaceae bacterium]
MNFIVDKRMPPDMIQRLSELGRVFTSAYVNTEDEAIRAHPDIQIHFVNENTAVAAPEVYDYYVQILPRYISLIKGFSPIGFTYPKNCAYNIARVGSNIICNIKYAEPKIIELYKSMGCRIINVRQGYAKCSICPISETTFITEDPGIYKTVSPLSEITVKLIPCGSVRLNGYDCGFIGGASGLCGDTAVFCGNAFKNPCLKKIAEEAKLKTYMLSNDDLYDYGSILCFS